MVRATRKRTGITRWVVRATAAGTLVVGAVGLGSSLAAAKAKSQPVVLGGHICTKVATVRHHVATGHAGDVVCGVSGNDVLKAAGPGIVTLVAGPGHHNVLKGSTNRRAHDLLVGSGVPGEDTFQTGGGDDTIETSPGDSITCSSTGTTTIAGDDSGDQEHQCGGGNVEDATQEWHGVVTSTDGTTTMTVQWSDVNDAAQAWLDANSDPATATFDISSAHIDMGDGGAVAAGDQVEVASNPSDPTNLAGSSLVAVSVDGQGSDSQSGGDDGNDQGGNGNGGEAGGGWTPTPCPSGTISGTTGSVLFLGTSCTLSAATVQGDLIVGPGATIAVQNGSSIEGDVATVGATAMTITGSSVHGDVRIMGSSGEVTVTSDTVTGDLDVLGNQGAVTIGGNTIGGDLDCAMNATSPTNGGGNTITGSATGQCAGF